MPVVPIRSDSLDEVLGNIRSIRGQAYHYCVVAEVDTVVGDINMFRFSPAANGELLYSIVDLHWHRCKALCEAVGWGLAEFERDAAAAIVPALNAVDGGLGDILRNLLDSHRKALLA